MHLEIISRSPQPSAPDRPAPLLFVHGAFGNAGLWDEHFLPYFAAQGYAAHALSLRGHGGSKPQGPRLLTGVADYVRDLDQAVQNLGVTPVLIGHSLGGVIVQKWLKHHQAPGAVLMGSGPPHGMLPSALGMWLRNPALAMQAVLLQALGPRTASAETTRKMLFSESPPPATIKRHFTRGAAESPRVGFDLLWPNLPGPAWPRDIPLLVLGAEKDFFISPSMVEATARVYGAQAEILPGLAHAMMLESGWQTAADCILHWLEQTIP